jgi:hypothetical protein
MYNKAHACNGSRNPNEPYTQRNEVKREQKEPRNDGGNSATTASGWPDVDETPPGHTYPFPWYMWLFMAGGTFHAGFGRNIYVLLSPYI